MNDSLMKYDRLDKERFKRAAKVSLKMEGKVIGVLAIYSSKNEIDRLVLSMFASTEGITLFPKRDNLCEEINKPEIKE